MLTETAGTRPARRSCGPDAVDQAAGLRRLLAPRGMRMLPICGALGSAGSAAIVAWLAQECAAIGLRVLIMDQSHGALAARFGLQARCELAHMLRGDRDWSRVALDCGQGITLLPAARGLAMLEPEGWTPALLRWIYGLPEPVDLVMLNLNGPDGARGLADAHGDWLFTVPRGEASALAAYRELKRLCGVSRPAAIRVLIEEHPLPGAAADRFGQLAAAARRFLDVDLDYCGPVPEAEWRGATGPHGYGRPGSTPGRLAAGLEAWRLRSYAPEAARASPGRALERSMRKS